MRRVCGRKVGALYPGRSAFSSERTNSAARRSDELDQWLRRKLRCILWRQWKKPKTRFKKLVSLGLDRERARASSGNGRGDWVERRRFAHERLRPRRPPGKVRTIVSLLDLHRRVARHVGNRRMPNGTYGGVRGEAGDGFTYSIEPLPASGKRFLGTRALTARRLPLALARWLQVPFPARGWFLLRRA